MDAYFKNEEERILVKSRYDALIHLCNDTFQKSEVERVMVAFEFLLTIHKDYRKKSGELCIIHSLEVAIITLQELGLGYNSVISALFHNLVLDHEVEIEDLRKKFDPQIVNIVEGLTKIGSITAKSVYNQAENFRKLILSLSNDVRVVLIKIADRLHNMRILHTLPQNAQIRISTETQFLFAPTAHRLGLYNIKTELEDLSLKYLNPDKYSHIVKKLDETALERNEFIAEFIKPIENDLKKNKLSFEIKSRTKSVFSIHNKMKKQGIPFEEVFDLFAIRIILNSTPEKEKSECWQVYSFVANHYQPNPKRMRDWISVPKTNGYESLHTTVIVPGGKWVEVQIRTERMDEIAEKGFAAHWKYKGIDSDKRLEQWLGRVREILETSASDDDKLVDEFKLNLYDDEVFVFTPNGDLKRFAAGSSVLDFAYDIHTDIGSSCTGAKLNGKNVSIKQKLINGAKIEILTSKNQKPRQEWLNFVKTSKAKSKIKHFLREEEFKEVENGREIVQRRFKNWKIPSIEAAVNKIIKEYKLKNASDLYYQVSLEKIVLSDLKELLEKEEEHPVDTAQHKEESESNNIRDLVKASKDFLIIDEKLDKIEYELAKCCNPINGDSIFGFVTINKGIKVHRTDCPNAKDMITKYPYRLVEAKWRRDVHDLLFRAAVKITGADEFDMISKITDVISKDMKVNLRSMETNTDKGIFQAIVKVNVKDKEHLQVLIHKLMKTKGISGVSRYDFMEE